MNNIESIVQTSCFVNNIKEDDFYTKKRDRHLLDVRRMVYAICREILEMTWVGIGKKFEVNHATIIHHYNVHKSLMDIDNIYHERFLSILELVKADLGYIDAKELLEEIRRVKSNKLMEQIRIKNLIKNQITENEN